MKLRDIISITHHIRKNNAFYAIIHTFLFSFDTEITPQFFAWISEFGKSAKIITENIAEKYQARLSGILESYES